MVFKKGDFITYAITKGMKVIHSKGVFDKYLKNHNVSVIDNETKKNTTVSISFVGKDKTTFEEGFIKNNPDVTVKPENELPKILKALSIGVKCEWIDVNVIDMFSVKGEWFFTYHQVYNDGTIDNSIIMSHVTTGLRGNYLDYYSLSKSEYTLEYFVNLTLKYINRFKTRIKGRKVVNELSPPTSELSTITTAQLCAELKSRGIILK